MTADPAAPHPDAVTALIAVTSCDAMPSRGDAALADLTEAVRVAAGADSALLWTVDGDGPEGRVAAATGLTDGGAGRLAAALAEMPERPEMRLAAGEGPLSGELAAIGASEGLLLPVSADGVPGGAVLLAGAEPLEHDPLRRHAARVGAERIGWVLAAVRMRTNLERAMAQILATDERMLGRIGLDIHDGPTQQLSVALLEVQLLEADLADVDEGGLPAPEALRSALARIYETVGGALHEMRELIGHLRPAQFEDRRLSDILQDAVDGFEARADCAVSARWEGEFSVNGVSITQRITLYRILQETLTNAHRHGRATMITVLAVDGDAGVTLEVVDNGQGFDPGAVQRRRPGMPLARFGLHGMRDRAQILGGSFDVTSVRGEGTTVRVFLPRWEGPPPEVSVDVA